MSILERLAQKVSPELAERLEARTRKGLETYGMTLDENPAPLSERLNHALEEALDLILYLEWAKEAADPALAETLEGLSRLAVTVAEELC
jgi:hypothetical protein